MTHYWRITYLRLRSEWYIRLGYALLWPVRVVARRFNRTAVPSSWWEEPTPPEPSGRPIYRTQENDGPYRIVGHIASNTITVWGDTEGGSE